jgi:hypothetical protein
LRKEREREVTARRGDRAVGRACARVAQRRSGNGRHEGHSKGEILSVRRRRIVSWTGGGVQVSTRHNEGRQHTAPIRLCARVGSATQGPRWCAFNRVSSASGAGGTRLRRRAPGVSIPAGAATGGSRAAGNVDVMLHGMRWQCDGSRRQVDRWALRWCEHSTCGRLYDGNSAGDDT